MTSGALLRMEQRGAVPAETEATVMCGSGAYDA